MCAELEEIVVDPDAIQPQGVGPEPGEDLFHWIAGRLELLLLARVKAGRRKWDAQVRKDVVRTAVGQPWVVTPPPVPSTIVMPERSLVIPPALVAELRAAGWDVRVKPGATHEIHVQDPAGLLALLADVLEPTPS